MIVTFYSYKGGVGRSMALANIATWLYQQGGRVLMVDWDLEAPGLESFFYSHESELQAVAEKPGIVDLIESYRQQWEQPFDLDEKSIDGQGKTRQLIERIGPIRHLFLPLAGTSSEALNRRQVPGLWLMHAGCRAGGSEANYTKTINSLDWTRFYDDYGGYDFIEWLKFEFSKDMDFILIDSRTGLTEMGGICTQHLADMAICFLAPNDSNLYGIERITSSLLGDALKKLRGSGRPMSVFPIPTRVDTQGDTQQLVLFEEKFRRAFHRFKTIDVDWCWESRIRYVTRYSYDEQVLFLDKSGHPDMMEAYSRIGQKLQRSFQERLSFSEKKKRKMTTLSTEKQDEKRGDDKESARRTVRQLVETAGEKMDAGEYETADSLLASARTLAENDLGEDHADTLWVKKNQVQAKFSKFDLDAAVSLQDEVYEDSLRILGQGHPDTIQSMMDLGYMLQAVGHDEKAYDIYSQSLGITLESKSDKRSAIAYYQMAQIMGNKGDMNTATNLLDRSVNLYEEFGDMDGMAKGLHAQGKIQYSIGNMEAGNEFLRRSLKYFEKLGDIEGKANCYYDLGKIHAAFEVEEEARYYLKESINLYASIDHLMGLGQAHLRLGDLEQQMGDLLASIAAFRQSLDCLEKNEDINALTDACIHIVRRMIPFGENRHAYSELLEGRFNEEKLEPFQKHDAMDLLKRIAALMPSDFEEILWEKIEMDRESERLV